MVVDGQPSPVVTAQGVLTLDSTPDELPNWTDAQIASHLERIERCVANGGVIIGAFDTCAGHEVMVGLSVLDGKWIGDEVDTLDMYFLFATREMRGRGVGRTLIEKISAEAKASIVYLRFTQPKYRQFLREAGRSVGNKGSGWT